MRIIVAGSRDMDHDLAWRALELTMECVGATVETEGHIILSGCSGVVDKCGESWAEGMNWPCRQYPADWDAHGKAAGPIRNREMAENADALILIWDGQSKGSRNMLDLAQSRELEIFETIIKFQSQNETKLRKTPNRRARRG